jgi:hypothetical protein
MIKLLYMEQARRLYELRDFVQSIKGELHGVQNWVSLFCSLSITGDCMLYPNPLPNDNLPTNTKLRLSTNIRFPIYSFGVAVLLVMVH